MGRFERTRTPTPLGALLRGLLQAPAPAQVGQRTLEGVFRTQGGADQIPALTNAMHWLYGSAQGGLYGLVQATIRANPLAGGLAFGAGVWTLSHPQLRAVEMHA